MPKSIVSSLGWFDSNQTKFKDWQRGIQLFLKSNKVIGIDNRITTILVYLRGSIANIYAQKKLDEIDEETDIPSWEEFVRELKITFSNKSKVANAKWKIKTFRQSKKYIANFMIEFEI